MGMDMEIGRDPQQAAEDQHQPPELEETGIRIRTRTQTEQISSSRASAIHSMANLYLCFGPCARRNDVLGWQASARHSPGPMGLQIFLDAIASYVRENL